MIFMHRRFLLGNALEIIKQLDFDGALHAQNTAYFMPRAADVRLSLSSRAIYPVAIPLELFAGIHTLSKSVGQVGAVEPSQSTSDNVFHRKRYVHSLASAVPMKPLFRAAVTSMGDAFILVGHGGPCDNVVGTSSKFRGRVYLRHLSCERLELM